MAWQLRAKVESVEVLDYHRRVVIHDVGGDLVLGDVASCHVPELEALAIAYQIVVETRGAEIGDPRHWLHCSKPSVDWRQSCHLVGLGYIEKGLGSIVVCLLGPLPPVPHIIPRVTNGLRDAFIASDSPLVSRWILSGLVLLVVALGSWSLGSSFSGL